MALYRTGLDMFRKYEKKFNPTVIGTRFTDVRDLALERAQDLQFSFELFIGERATSSTPE